MNCRFKEVLLAVKLGDILLVTGNENSLLLACLRTRHQLRNSTSLDEGSSSGSSVKAGLPSTRCSESVGEGALRVEFQSHFTSEVGILEGLVVTEVGEDTFLDLS